LAFFFAIGASFLDSPERGINAGGRSSRSGEQISFKPSLYFVGNFIISTLVIVCQEKNVILFWRYRRHERFADEKLAKRFPAELWKK
jgi:hypothetical protein